MSPVTYQLLHVPSPFWLKLLVSRQPAAQATRSTQRSPMAGDEYNGCRDSCCTLPGRTNLCQCPKQDCELCYFFAWDHTRTLTCQTPKASDHWYHGEHARARCHFCPDNPTRKKKEQAKALLAAERAAATQAAEEQAKADPAHVEPPQAAEEKAKAGAEPAPSAHVEPPPASNKAGPPTKVPPPKGNVPAPPPKVPPIWDQGNDKKDPWKDIAGPQGSGAPRAPEWKPPPPRPPPRTPRSNTPSLGDRVASDLDEIKAQVQQMNRSIAESGRAVKERMQELDDKMLAISDLYGSINDHQQAIEHELSEMRAMLSFTMPDPITRPQSG